MIRIRAEREVNRGKVAVIKAYHLRNPNNLNFKEVLTVSLNEQSNNRPYVLGRLFAVLEKAQLDANANIKATIKDRYFTSACATPASVFPVLLRLSNHHIAKSDYGHISERRIQELMDKLDLDSNPFPAHLSLDEQGIFILGYYHQKKANYTKLTKEEE
jgi:CRISPR-associated protein Csd1